MPYGVCKICGCTDNDPCFHPEHGTCWWADDSHELCSHCADEKIYNDPATKHCINSTDPHLQILSAVLVCKNCTHWHKKAGDERDGSAWGDCDLHPVFNISDEPMCVDFDEKEG